MGWMKICLAAALLNGCLNFSHAADERIFVPAKINGIPVRFSFDTGTGAPIVLYSTTARKLHLKVTPPPADARVGPGQTQMGWTGPQELDFGVTNFDTSFLVAEVPAYLNWPEDGLLGWPAISNNVFSINCIADKLNFLTNLPANTGDWVECRIQTNSDDLTLVLPGDQSPRRVIALDTGYYGGVKLDSKSWRGWEMAHTNQPTTLDAYYTPSIGLVVKNETWAACLDMGPLALTEVPVEEADSTDIASHSKPGARYVATLGFAAMKRLDIIIDGRHGMAWLRPKQTPPLPYWHNRLGAVFVPRDLKSDDLVAQVIKGSPAFVAGIRNGDVLLKIGDLDCTQWRTDSKVLPLSRFFNGPAGTKLEFTVKRAGKIVTVAAVLRNILPPDTATN